MQVSLTNYMAEFKYLVDDRDLSAVKYIQKSERMNAREDNEHTFKKKLSAEAYRLEKAGHYYRMRGEIAKSEEYFKKLKSLNEDYPEWQI